MDEVDDVGVVEDDEGDDEKDDVEEESSDEQRVVGVRSASSKLVNTTVGH